MNGRKGPTSNTKLVVEVLALARELLEAQGWRKRSGEIYTLNLANDVIGWLGLNRAVGRGEPWMEINPVIGVRHLSLERTLSELLETKFHLYNPPTIRVNLGYLMSERSLAQWGFGPGGENTTRVKNMVDMIDLYGRPFLEANVTLRRVLDRMLDKEMSFGFPHQLAFRIPVAYFLLGDQASARTYLAQQIKSLGLSQVDEEAYQRFADRLSRLMAKLAKLAPS